MDDSKEPLRVVFKSEETPLSASVDGRNLIDSYKGKSIEEIKNNLAANKTPFEVAIENFQHDFNIGTVVRNANAFNARAVHIIGKKHWNRRGAMKTEVYLDVYHHKDVTSFIAWSMGHRAFCLAMLRRSRCELACALRHSSRHGVSQSILTNLAGKNFAKYFPGLGASPIATLCTIAPLRHTTQLSFSLMR